MCKLVHLVCGDCKYARVTTARCPSRGPYTPLIPQRCLHGLNPERAEHKAGGGKCLDCLLEKEGARVPKKDDMVMVEKVQAGEKKPKKKGKSRRKGKGKRGAGEGEGDRGKGEGKALVVKKTVKTEVREGQMVLASFETERVLRTS